MIKKYLQFIKEDIDENDEIDFSSESPEESNIPVEKKDEFNISDYEDLKSDLEEMIQRSLKESTRSNQKDFIKEYLKGNDGAQIEGLINDSDIYEFYLKYRNDIDDILTLEKFFEKSPSSHEVYSLYDYIIEGTETPVKKIIQNI